MNMMTIAGKFIIPVLLLSLCFMSCEADNNMSRYPQKGGVSGGKPEGDGNVQNNKLNLTPFTMLNQGESELNSHADEWKKSVLKRDFRSHINLGKDVIKVDNPQYARMVRLKDGSYILTYHYGGSDNVNGYDVHWATSKDMKEWTDKGFLFKRYASPGSQNIAGDKRVYTNGNGLVLENGDVLLFASYRQNKSYGKYECRYENGIEMIRSSDNGKTWSARQEIHHGPNWEAIMLELPSGELQCYFSESRPWISGSHSGTSMVNSTDGGRTWLPSVEGKDPYRCIRRTWYDQSDNRYKFTDQMAAIIRLNGSEQFAGAFEAADARKDDLVGKVFNIDFAYSPEDGKWEYMTGDEGDGKDFDVEHAVCRPTDILKNRWAGTGPDLKQFRSGETVVSNRNSSAKLAVRIGDANAREFGEPFNSLDGKGSWGSLLVKTDHELVACMRNSADKNNITIEMAAFALNHSIKATSRNVAVDGNNQEWADTDEALFVGSKCQAQATLRCSADEKNVYFLVEVLDENVSDRDYAYVYIADPASDTMNEKTLRIQVCPKGLARQSSYNAVGWKDVDSGVSAFIGCDATVSDASDKDNGWLAEISVPRSVLSVSGGKIRANFSLVDYDGGEDSIIQTAGTTDTSRWMDIKGL